MQKMCNYFYLKALYGRSVSLYILFLFLLLSTSGRNHTGSAKHKMAALACDLQLQALCGRFY